MGIVLSTERCNTSCFCARTNKMRNKYCKIKTANRNSKTARIAKLGTTKENNFIEITKLNNMNSK